MADYKVPELKEYPVIPMPKAGVMSQLSPFVAKEDFQSALHYPSKKVQEEGKDPKYVLIDGWHDKAIEKMDDLLGRYRGFRVFMDSCVKCGACTDKCHYFIGTGDAKNMPVARQDMLRSVYRRYFTFAGKYFPKLVGARDLTEDVVDEWYSYFHQCDPTFGARPLRRLIQKEVQDPLAIRILQGEFREGDRVTVDAGTPSGFTFRKET